MTRFQDGPAKGQVLMLKRAARFLRVTAVIALESGKVTKWDALDQVTDQALPDETLYAYEIVGQPYMVHLNAGKASGFYPGAEYLFVTTQPTDREMRSNELWHLWCLAHNT